MASNTKQQTPSCVGVSTDNNTRTNTDQPGFLLPHNQMTSAPYYGRMCQFCQSIKCAMSVHRGNNRPELVCAGCRGAPSCDTCRSQQHTPPIADIAGCSCRPPVCENCLHHCQLQSAAGTHCCSIRSVQPPLLLRHQHNSTCVSSHGGARRVLSNRRSLSLPRSTKNSYDVVVSEGLSCGGLLQSSAANRTVGHYRPVKQAFSYNLVKMEIELELANSVPDELKALESNDVVGAKSKEREHGIDDLTDTCCDFHSSSDEELDLGVGSCHGESSTGISHLYSTNSALSVRLKPNVVSRNNKKRLGRSHSWTPSTNFMDLNSDNSSESQNGPCIDFKSDMFEVVSKKGPDGCDVISEGFENIRRRRIRRNVHTNLSLNEQEIQALQEHLEQNLYVPVQLLIGSEGSRRRMPSASDKPLFILAEAVTAECCVCLEIVYVRQRECCDAFVCDDCLKTYLVTMVNQRLLGMQCPKYACEKYLSRAEISYHLDLGTREKFQRFLLEANSESHIKTCPHCNYLTRMDKQLLTKKHLSPHEAKIVCKQCEFQWCFPCQAPWHDGLTCKEYRKGDQLLRDWSKQRHLGVANAHRCPKCRVFIQRSSGCDHMTCSKCGTEFCYQCGGRFHRIRYFGNHYSRYSVFGCKYRYKPENPVARKVIRGSILGCQILATPLCVGLVAAGGCVIVPLALVVVPTVYGASKLRHYLAVRKERQRRKKIEKEDKELGDALVMSRYVRRCRYRLGERQVEVSYP